MLFKAVAELRAYWVGATELNLPDFNYSIRIYSKLYGFLTMVTCIKSLNEVPV